MPGRGSTLFDWTRKSCGTLHSAVTSEVGMEKALTAVLVLLLAGCSSSQQRLTDTYSSAGGIPFQHGNQKWLVMDRRDIGSMLIQYDAFGTTQRVAIPKQSFEKAAAAYLATVGCQVKNGSEAVALAYEFTYRCTSPS
jgi:hypothetical protein